MIIPIDSCCLMWLTLCIFNTSDILIVHKSMISKQEEADRKLTLSLTSVLQVQLSMCKEQSQLLKSAHLIILPSAVTICTRCPSNSNVERFKPLLKNGHINMLIKVIFEENVHEEALTVLSSMWEIYPIASNFGFVSFSVDSRKQEFGAKQGNSVLNPQFSSSTNGTRKWS